jgi:transcriptional regulator with XRE-family HTH domain
MERYGREIGVVLRTARRDRGMTLRRVSTLSGERFKPTSVAGYERGERSISLKRFIELCQLYGVPPHALLAQIMRAIEGSTEPDVDLTVLEASGSADEALIAGFIRRIRALRRDHPSGTVSLRAEDLEVLASAAGKRLDEVLEALTPGAEPPA